MVWFRQGRSLLYFASLLVMAACSAAPSNSPIIGGDSSKKSEDTNGADGSVKDPSELNGLPSGLEPANAPLPEGTSSGVVNRNSTSVPVTKPTNSTGNLPGGNGVVVGGGPPAAGAPGVGQGPAGTVQGPLGGVTPSTGGGLPGDGVPPDTGPNDGDQPDQDDVCAAVQSGEVPPRREHSYAIESGENEFVMCGPHEILVGIEMEASGDNQAKGLICADACFGVSWHGGFSGSLEDSKIYYAGLGLERVTLKNSEQYLMKSRSQEFIVGVRKEGDSNAAAKNDDSITAFYYKTMTDMPFLKGNLTEVGFNLKDPGLRPYTCPADAVVVGFNYKEGANNSLSGLVCAPYNRDTILP